MGDLGPVAWRTQRTKVGGFVGATTPPSHHVVYLSGRGAARLATMPVPFKDLGPIDSSTLAAWASPRPTPQDRAPRTSHDRPRPPSGHRPFTTGRHEHRHSPSVTGARDFARMGQRGPAGKPTALRVLHGDRRSRIEP